MSNIEIVRKNLGPVTAYKYAVQQGYTGTEQEFAALMASYATVAEEAEAAKDDAIDAKTAAEAAQAAAEAAAEQAEGAIEVDDTLSVEGRAADAKKTGDEINDLKANINSIFSASVPVEWEIGTINANTGIQQESTARIRTVKAITPVSGKLTYAFPSGYKANIYVYTGDIFTKTGFVTTGGSILLDGVSSFKVVFAKSDDSTLIDTSISSNLSLSFESDINISIERLFGVAEGCSNLINENDF